MKPCTACGLVKPLSDFYRNKIISDGHENTCKPCFRKRQNKWRWENIAKVRAAQRAFVHSEESIANKKAWTNSAAGKASHARATARWRAKNRIKCRAHKKLNNAIIRGELTRQPCEKCGVRKVDAHHDDYSKPLQVRWLCRKHHVEFHKPAYVKPLPENAIANAAYEAKVAKGLA